jgi:hypothetical protein
MPNRGRIGGGYPGVIAACFVAAVLGAAGAVSAGPPCPCPEEIYLTKGDQYVVIEWEDPPDSLLYGTVVEETGWTGHCSPVAGGFKADCDNRFELSMQVSGTTVQVIWSEMYSAEQPTFNLTNPDSFYALSRGVRVRFPSTAELDLSLWGGNSVPRLSGYFVTADSAIYTVQAHSSGTVAATRAGTTPGLDLVWVDAVSGASGSLAIPRGDSLLSFNGGLKVSFAPGEIAADSVFILRAWRAVVDEEVLRIEGHAFGGYKIWRSDVLNLNEPRLIHKLNLCNPADSVFFRCPNRFFVDGVDPWYQAADCQGTIIRDTHERIMVTGDVTNAFPYYYGVTTFDTEDDLVTVDYDPRSGAGHYWKKVYPSQAPRTDVSEIRVIPNPYNVREDWEEGEAKITFDNLPSRATIYVYDVIGELVIRLEHSSPTDDFEPWNLKSATGRDVVSGVYLFKVESSEGDKVGKFIVIR